MEKRIQLSMKESKKIPVLEELKHQKITQEMASERLNLSIRQVGRTFKRYLSTGAAGLVHRNRGRPNLHKTPQKSKDQIIEIIQDCYSDFGPVLATEMLEERHDIRLSREAVRKIMIEAGIYRKKRKGVKYRRYRAPKERRGEMQQLDGSIHAWFEGRAPKCWLLRFTDDATGEFMHGEFATAESYKAVAHATITNFKKHGLPLALYTDKGKVFRVNYNNDDGELVTQYERALHELDVELIHANSPQAKGRVERNFRTDQDRLVKMLRINNINTIEAANQYIKEVYLPNYNRKFSRPAACPENAHRPLNDVNLLNIFCIREERKVRNDWTFQYHGRIIQINDQRPALVKPKDLIDVYERLDGSIYIKRGSHVLSCIEVNQRPVVEQEPKPLKLWRPGKRHPWKRSNSMFFRKKGHFQFAKEQDIITLR